MFISWREAADLRRPFPRADSSDGRDSRRDYRLYADLVAHWHRVLPGFVHDVSYEHLVTRQRETLGELLGVLPDAMR